MGTEAIKKETRKINRQAYQEFIKDIIAEDTTNNVFRLVKVRDMTQLALGKTRPVNCSKGQQSARHCIQEPDGMPGYRPDTLLLRPCASSARVRMCGVGPPSATSGVHIGDGATMVSPLHP